MDAGDAHSLTHAGGIILNQKDEALLVCNDIGYWTFPRGHIDSNEDVLTAAIREIAEETGIKQLDLISKLPIYQRVRANDPKKVMIIQMFLFQTNEVETYVADPHIAQVAWVKKDNVIETLSVEGDREYYNSIQPQLLKSR